MLIKDVMSPECSYCGVDDNVVTVARIMAVKDVGVVPVAKDDKLVGMVTDRDLVVRALAIQDEFPSVTAGDVMTDAVYYCYDDQHCADVAQNMAKMKVRRMPVVTRDKVLVGLVSLEDFASNEEIPAAIEALQGVSSDNASLSATSNTGAEIPASAGGIPASRSKN